MLELVGGVLRVVAVVRGEWWWVVGGGWWVLRGSGW